MPVHVVTQGNVDRSLSAAFVRRVGAKMLDALQIKDAELSIVLTDDAQIKILNRDYRHKDRPTDVLAFAIREGAHGDLAGEMLGDVVISLETAARQAREHGHSLREEGVFLLAHGLLHLLGWDHDTKAKDAAMRRESERLCAAASVPAPAAAGGVVNTKSKKRATKKRTSRAAPSKTPRKTRRPGTGSVRRKIV